jgi:hypothetical protein
MRTPCMKKFLSRRTETHLREIRTVTVRSREIELVQGRSLLPDHDPQMIISRFSPEEIELQEMYVLNLNKVLDSISTSAVRSVLCGALVA